jgi:hypothetical protein
MFEAPARRLTIGRIKAGIAAIAAAAMKQADGLR